MTINEAKNNLREIRFLDNITSDDEFLYIVSLEFLIKETNDPTYMMELGGLYYEKQEFDLALKYYDMAAFKDYDPAFSCLGYIWYYGRTGVKDYKKAYENFEKAMKKGNIVAAYGKQEVKKALRSIVWIKYKIKDVEVFDKAYKYIEQYY